MPTTTDEARQEIAGNVRALLGKKRSNGNQLAKVLGLSAAAVSRRLNGQLAFDTDELLLIAAHFDVEVTDFFLGVDPPRIHGPLQNVQLDLFDLAA